MRHFKKLNLERKQRKNQIWNQFNVCPSLSLFKYIFVNESVILFSLLAISSQQSLNSPSHKHSTPSVPLTSNRKSLLMSASSPSLTSSSPLSSSPSSESLSSPISSSGLSQPLPQPSPSPTLSPSQSQSSLVPNTSTRKSLQNYVQSPPPLSLSLSASTILSSNTTPLDSPSKKTFVNLFRSQNVLSEYNPPSSTRTSPQGFHFQLNRVGVDNLTTLPNKALHDITEMLKLRFSQSVIYVRETKHYILSSLRVSFINEQNLKLSSQVVNQLACFL